MLPQYSTHQWILLISAYTFNVFSTTVATLQGPYFPREAEEHGVSATVYGIIIGMHDITIVIMSPVIGWYFPKRYLVSGFKATPLIISISCMLFGTLHDIEDSTVFIVLALLLRFVKGIASALLFVSASELISKSFQESDRLLSFLQVCRVIGTGCALVLGGVSLDNIGFLRTFMFFGLILTVIVIPCVFNLKVPSISESDEEMKGNRLSALGYPMVWICLFGTLIEGAMELLNETGLERHLQSFKLTNAGIGAILYIWSISYFIGSIILGYLTPIIGLQCACIGGIITACIGFSLLGPVPILPLDTSVPLACLGNFMFGFGGAWWSLTTLLLCIKESGETKTVSGIWFCVLHLGKVLGSSGGGALIDFFGFNSSTMVILALGLISLLAMFGKVITKKSSEYETMSNVELN